MVRTRGQQNANGVSSTDSATGRHAGSYGLIDIESGNMVGSFRSEEEALLAVAATANEYGVGSDAVLSLSLFRDDVPPEQGFIADGEDLVRRALSAADTSRKASEALPNGGDHGVPGRKATMAQAAPHRSTRR